MTDPITFEDVLDELMLEEPKPDYEALVRWQERYPKYRKELADFFATWSVQEHRAQSKRRSSSEMRLSFTPGPESRMPCI